MMSILVELPEDQYSRNAFDKVSLDAGFDLATARAMAWVSQLSYETGDPNKIERVMALWGLAPIRILRQPARTTLPLSNTHGLIASKDGAIIIGFAGTDPADLLNWISDFYIGHLRSDVHEGFQDAANAVWDEVGAQIDRCVKVGQPVFFTGHSLGAAIALVAAERGRTNHGLTRAEVYVFGSPRVGRTAFKKRYNANFGPTTYRFVHGEDIVATVPPSELDFRHVGRLLHCQRGQKFDSDTMLDSPDSDEPLAGPGFLNGVAQRLRDLVTGPLSPTSRIDRLGRLSELLAPSIGDHLPDRYYTALTQ
jgi:triacylglycerol lipase